MYVKILLWIMLVVPWFTLFFLKKEIVKRFMPVGIFTTLLMILYNLVAYNQKHWIIKVSIIPSLNPAFVPGILGAFIVITIWIFHFSFGRFWLYVVINLIADFMFAVFPIHYLLQEKLKIYQLINISPWGRFVLFVFLSIIIYAYQLWQEEVFNSKLKETD